MAFLEYITYFDIKLKQNMKAYSIIPTQVNHCMCKDDFKIIIMVFIEF